MFSHMIYSSGVVEYGQMFFYLKQCFSHKTFQNINKGPKMINSTNSFKYADFLI